jgi:hypothetical protein
MAALLVVAIVSAMAPPRALPRGKIHPLYLSLYFGSRPLVVRRVIPFLGARPDGRFAYVIPAGRYQMSHMEPLHYMPHIDPALAFDGATPCRAYYLGDLEVDIETTSWLGGLWGDSITRLDRLELADRFDPGQGRFTGCDGGPEPVLKALLGRIPGRTSELKSNFPASLMGTFPGGLR